MTISIIAAVSDNGVIGRSSELPWRQSTDLKRLKSLTMGHHMIMGRKTFDTIGKTLPGRTFIVVTRQSDVDVEGVIVARSVPEAIERAAGDPEAFIAGGGEIYRQSMHIADRMYLTRIHADLEGDTFFPEFDDVAEWELVDAEHFEADEKNQYPFTFLTYERRAASAEPAKATTG